MVGRRGQIVNELRYINQRKEEVELRVEIGKVEVGQIPNVKKLRKLKLTKCPSLKVQLWANA
eukprot:scaffold14291_cov71-Skeletonema_dohrnii-CCMP3373.AAC.2